MTNPIQDYYRCPQEFVGSSQVGPLNGEKGFFLFGEAVCFGRCSAGQTAKTPTESLHDCAPGIEMRGLNHLPFDPGELVDNLRLERYAASYADTSRLALFNALVRHAYYLVRPALPVSIRKYLQRLHLRTWNNVGFPHWPVDCTVDRVMEKLVLLALKATGDEAMPLIWFWPEGMPSAAIMTHDVETKSGRDFCNTLMDIDDAYAIKSSFQVVPESRYPVSRAFLDDMQTRGFEVNVHDLNHDGHLFQEKKEFMRRAAKINEYLREYGASGFRSAIMYRNQDWFESLDAAYDMSVPNAAHLDPQRGGCCTVMPYSIGKLIELPVTMTQDYSLFNILGCYSTDLWCKQIELVMQKHGLISFIVHPDYVIEEQARATYHHLLQHLYDLRSQRSLWIPLPRDVYQWWQQRSEMQLVRSGQGWTIEGPGKERACVAYAHADGDRLVYSIERRGSARFRPRTRYMKHAAQRG